MTTTPGLPSRLVTAADIPRSASAANRPWLRLFGGVATIALGIAAFAWPEATVQVIAILFGLHLVVTGFVRAGLSLRATGTVLHRVLDVILGVLTGLLGVLCLRDLTGSLVLLLVVVALGWLLDGLAQLARAVSGPARERGGPQIATALITVAGAIAVLIWPRISFGVFIFIGSTVLVFAGIGTCVGSRGEERSRKIA
ncbi:DUF308 domain-containing protein [Actinoplanes sp. NPDC048791]|uniref:HdeD family acid-resistance protein n=1 Tax=Actinoplanes sp. NPDC048791 TaxID=3154623 RepID=UPI0033C597AC